MELGVPGIDHAEEIARGGFSIVYRARQTAVGRDVAVKVLTSRPDATTTARFQREIAAMVALSDHPAILPIHDAGTTADGAPYMVMPYMSGGSVQDRLDADGAMGWQEAQRIGVRIAEALSAAHGADVLHRDLKPANLLIDRYGNAILADFGIARVEGGHKTASGVITASVSHAAPEVLDGQAPTVASDIYGLASTIYAIASGRAPFDSDTDQSLVPLISRVLTQPMPALDDAPAAFTALLASAMAKDPEQRPTDAKAFGRALGDIAADSSVAPAAPEEEPPDPAIPDPSATVHLTGPAQAEQPIPGAPATPSGAHDSRPSGHAGGEAVDGAGRRVGFAAGALAIVVIVVLGLVVLLPRGDDLGGVDTAAESGEAAAGGQESGEPLGEATQDPDPDDDTGVDDPDPQGDSTVGDVVVAQSLTEILAGVDEDPGSLLPIFDPGRLGGLDPLMVREAQANQQALEARQVPAGAIPMGPRSVPLGEGVTVQHILVGTFEEAQRARDRIATGEPFAAIANELSLDADSQGGVLGPLVPGALVPALEDAAITTLPGQLTPPIETELGWHIIRTAGRPGVAPGGGIGPLGMQAVTVDIPVPSGIRILTRGDELDVAIVLLDDEGRFLAGDDDQGGGDTGANALLDHQVDAGQVTIVVANLENQRGEVEVIVTVGPRPVLQQGETVAALTPQQQTVFYDLGVTGTTQQIALTAGTFDGWLRVTDVAGRVRADARGGTNPVIDLRGLEPGGYLLAVGHDDAGVAVGDYSLRLE